jgi:hypothetical protein
MSGFIYTNAQIKAIKLVIDISRICLDSANTVFILLAGLDNV